MFTKGNRKKDIGKLVAVITNICEYILKVNYMKACHVLKGERLGHFSIGMKTSGGVCQPFIISVEPNSKLHFLSLGALNPNTVIMITIFYHEVSSSTQ